jgi:hypothetical protein
MDTILDKLNNTYDIISNSEMEGDDKDYCMSTIAVALLLLKR